MKPKNVFAKTISPTFRRHLSVILIAILLSTALFAGIAAADDEILDTEMPPAGGGQGMGVDPMLLDNGTMPVDIDNLTTDMGVPPMPLDNETMPVDPMLLDNETMPVDPAATETAESPIPVLGIVAGLGAAAAFLIKRRT